MSGCALAIFVKTPGHSPIKTRLAATRGQAFAERFHLLAAAAVAETARLAASAARTRGEALKSYWAVAEPEAMQSPHWAGLPRLDQGPGGLGQRMARIHSTLLEGARGALLVGADSPQMTPALVLQACDWLDHPEARCVIGPARDGGFWLFGSNMALPESTWTSVAYSRGDTAAALVATLSTSGSVAWLHLPELVDVDVDEDLRQLGLELERINEKPPRQAALQDWLPRQARGSREHEPRRCDIT